MGTRADFYVGRGLEAEWLGSIAWDGYPEGIDHDAVGADVLDAEDAEAFRAAVAAYLASRDDATVPEQGWPWPWDDSGTTDYAYAWDGKVWASFFGHAWFAVDRAVEHYGRPGSVDPGPESVFPDMTARKNVTYHRRRSGVIVLGGPNDNVFGDPS